MDLPAEGHDPVLTSLVRLSQRLGELCAAAAISQVEDAFNKDAKLSDIRGYVEDSGEGRWTIQQALETGVAAEVTTLSLLRRFRSRQQDPFSDRVLAALRREFGGHSVVKST